MHRGAAHTPGDSFVWLDGRDVRVTGDIVYVDRLLGNGPAGDTDSWIAVFEAMAAYNQRISYPATATLDTCEYLVTLRSGSGR